MQPFMFVLVMVLLPLMSGTADLGNLVCNSEELRQTGRYLFTLKEQQFKFCDEIKYLNLTKNNIHFIENRVFKNMKNLNIIDLSSNVISTLPTSIFSDTKHLEEFYITNNRITSLGKNLFANLPFLTSVNFAFNNITYIEKNCFVNVPSLTGINLVFNNLKTLQFNIIDDISSLSIFYLVGNPWHCGPDLCEFMHTVVARFWREPFVPYCYSPRDIRSSTFKEVIETPLPSVSSNVEDNPRAEPVVMTCRTCSKSSISWQFEGSTTLTNKAVQTSGKYNTLSTLTIYSFSQFDRGNYTCYVGNCPSCESSTWIHVSTDTTYRYVSNTGRNVGLSVFGGILFVVGICCRICRQMSKNDTNDHIVPINRPGNTEEV